MYRLFHLLCLDGVVIPIVVDCAESRYIFSGFVFELFFIQLDLAIVLSDLFNG